MALTLVAVGCHSDDSALQAVERSAEVHGSLSFGEVYVGEERVASFQVAATGQGAVQVLAIDGPEGVTAQVGLPLVVSTGQSESVSVLWRPKGAGSLKGRVLVVVDVKDQERWFVPVEGTALATPSCDDNNPCTEDTFSFASATCIHEPLTGPCDDGNACTEDDRCFDGTCVGIAKTCDDGIDCTLDTCDKSRGCVFSPVDSACTDSDPCTIDTCDPGSGCQHSQAAVGTPCDDVVACKTFFGCDLFGNCSAFDISGVMEGYPCDDGDPCTEGDVCSGGACESGVALPTVPEVLARTPLFGGQGAHGGRLGDTYLFAHPQRVDVVTLQDGALVWQGRLEVNRPLPPLGVSEQRFVIGSPTGTLELIDVSDPAHPKVTDTITLAHPAWPQADVMVREMGTLGDALVVAVGFVRPDEAEDHLLRIPIESSGWGAPQLLATSAAPIQDVATYQDTLAFLNGHGLQWRRLDGSGAAAAQGTIDTQAKRVALGPNRAALLLDAQVQLWEPLGAGEQLVASWELPQAAQDLALVADRILLAFNGPIGGVAEVDIANPVEPLHLIERTPTWRLHAAGDVVLTAGVQGLLLRHGASWERLTGPGHGDLQRVTAGPGAVLGAGALASAVIEVGNAPGLSEWSLREAAVGAGEAAVLSTAVGAELMYPGPPVGVLTGPCDGAAVTVVTQLGAQSWLACDLHRAGGIAVGGHRLWAFAPEESAWSITGWPLAPEALPEEQGGPKPPLLPSTFAGGVLEGEHVLALHANSSTRLVAFSSAEKPEQINLTLMNTSGATAQVGATFAVPCRDCLERGAHLLLKEGSLLWAHPEGVTSYDEMGRVLAEAPASNPRLLTGEGARLWWTEGAVLRQLADQGAALQPVGSVQLQGEAISAVEQSSRLVVVTDRELAVVAPACY